MVQYPSKVLLATDGTEDSARAARVAGALATTSGAVLNVVHVGRVPGASEVGGAAAHPPLPGEPPGYAEREARRLLERQVEEIEAGGATVAEAHLRLGQPAAEVVAEAASSGADLLVVGGGEPRPIRRAVATAVQRATLGGAADLIVRTAPCPVLVVRGDGPYQGAAPGEGTDETKKGGSA